MLFLQLEYTEVTIREDTFFVSQFLNLEYISLDKKSSMKLLSLLTVAIVLIGITTQAFACYYERMSRSPSYAKITTPKKTLSIPRAHGICIAPNGNFAVMSPNNAKKIRIYYSCGKLMKTVNLEHGFRAAHDCAFTERYLYVADYNGRKVHVLSPLGKFVRVLATGVTFFRIEACRNRLYVTTAHGGQNVHVYDTNNESKVKKF